MHTLLAAEGGLTLLDHAVVVVYLAGMLGMGVYIALRQRSTDDFFVGGRNLPSWAVGISLLASLLSTITYLGMPGEMFRTGVAFLTRQLGVPLVLLVVWFLWLPFFSRLKLTSAYEYLERRFDYPTRALAAAFCITLLLGWMSVVVLTAANAMAQIAALDLNWFFGRNTQGSLDADVQAIIVSVGLFSVVYTTLGGIRAVVWTDVIQFVILVGGAFFTMGWIAWSTNSGLGDWMAAQAAYPHRESVEWYSFDVGNRSTILFISVGMFFWFTCTHGANQVALQRYFSVKDQWAARKSYLVSALASFGLGTVLAGVGLSLVYYVSRDDVTLPAEEAVYASVPDGATETEQADQSKARSEGQDAIFPQFIRLYLPAGVRGLVVAALFAAAMSTIDSGANSISTIVTVDYFRRLHLEEKTIADELRLARVLTASMGLVIVAITLFLYHASKGTDIITLCQKGFNCFLGPLGGLFFLGMFWRKATPAAVIPAILLGETVGVCASYSEEFFGVAYSTHLVVPGAWATTVLSGIVLSTLLRTEPSAEQARWTWLPVVRGGSAPLAPRCSACDEPLALDAQTCPACGAVVPG